MKLSDGFMRVLATAMIIAGAVAIIFGVIPNKKAEIIMTKAKYLGIEVDRSYVMAEKEEEPRYYAYFDVDGIREEIYLGHSRRRIKTDTEGRATLYRDEQHEEWCLTEAEARTQSRVMIAALGIMLVFFGGAWFMWGQ